MPVTPAPCLSALPPDPPRVDAGDEAWVSYHVAVEGYLAAVVAECGAHLSGADAP